MSAGSIIGIDQSGEVIARASLEFAPTAHPNLSFRVGDVYHLDFPDATFDVVYVHQVLQHLGDPVVALREMSRVLKPSGILAARDADFGGFFWTPSDPVLDRWLALYHDVTLRNGAQADAGRMLKMWVRDAGFRDVVVSSSNWTYESDDERGWWGGLWADRVIQSDIARQAIDYELATLSELEEIATAFRRWARDPDGVFIVPSVEVIAHPALR